MQLHYQFEAAEQPIVHKQQLHPTSPSHLPKWSKSCNFSSISNWTPRICPIANGPRHALRKRYVIPWIMNLKAFCPFLSDPISTRYSLSENSEDPGHSQFSIRTQSDYFLFPQRYSLSTFELSFIMCSSFSHSFYMFFCFQFWPLINLSKYEVRLSN